jgi:hypothetical protein
LRRSKLQARGPRFAEAAYLECDCPFGGHCRAATWRERM